jgi:phosphatidylglycerophosphatase A
MDFCSTLRVLSVTMCDMIKHSPISYAATWFGSGNAPKAAGTFGSLAALPWAYVIHEGFGGLVLGVLAVLVCVLGVWATDAYITQQHTGDDPKEVVIDEVAGMWLTLACVAPTWQGYTAAFILFRFFDILKPFPISWVDKHVHGGLGVMLDDVLAAFAAIGVYAAVTHYFGL